MYKVKSKFKIRESVGGAYVVVFFYEKMLEDIDTFHTLIDGCPIEQWYPIPEKNEIAFRLKHEEDLDKIGDDYVTIQNIDFNSEGFSC